MNKSIILLLPLIMLVGNVLAFFPNTINAAAMDVAVENYSCSGEMCNLSNSNDNSSYTYQDNLNDPKCYYNLNFCNLDYNVTLPEGAQQLIDLLKQANYQMSDELQNKTESINQLQKENHAQYMAIIIISGIAIIFAIWSSFLIFERRKEKK
jgi:hypothetical protein